MNFVSPHSTPQPDVFIHHFHQAAPYIHYLRGKTLILVLSSQILDTDNLTALTQDIQLLNSLGIRLVLLYSFKQQLQQLAHGRNHILHYHEGHCITDQITLQLAKQAKGIVQCDLEAALSTSPTQTPDHHVCPLTLSSGNFLLSRPLGVINGTDMGYSGTIRKINTHAIRERLDQNQIVLIGPIGYSLSGQAYTLGISDVAQTLAVSLKAEKLIFLDSEAGLLDTTGQLINQMTDAEIDILLQQNNLNTEKEQMLRAAQYVLQHDITRVHIVSGLNEGSLIQELFTHEGCGTSLARNSFVRVRTAEQNDIGDILQLIAPLQAAGILLPRDREYMENHIDEFAVLEHDCHVYGCVALHLYRQEAAGELGCLVVSPEARSKGYGELLLQYIIKYARQQQLRTLFALSTQTGDWFLERGFMAATLEELPPIRQNQYILNQRCSRIYRYCL